VRLVPTAIAALLAAALLGACGSKPGPTLRLPPPQRLPRSATSHVVVVVMENKEYDEVIGSPEAPYVAALARRYASPDAMYAIRHPSLPNYIALTGGDTFGIDSNCTSCNVSAPSLADQLERAGRTWKAYMEGMPRRCFKGPEQGGYAKKHDPFMYYDDVARNPRRCRRVVGFDQLAADLRSGALPTYAFVSPDLCHDTHDCDVATGDRFLAGLVPRLLRELGPRGFLVLTWDEGSSDAGCCTDALGGRIATIVAGPGARRRAHSARPVDHYGVLGTVERALGLPPLGGAAQPRSGTLDPLLAHPRVR
jgi:hypothetical protein